MRAGDAGQVFVAYSHHDAAVKDAIVKQVQVALYGLSYDLWDDTRIGAGEQWRDAIEAAVDRCAAALLLVSVDSLTSKYILEAELPRLLERMQRDGLPVFPILVRSCPWRNLPWLERLEIRPKDGQPLRERADAEAKMADIATELAARLQPSKSQQSPPVPPVSQFFSALSRAPVAPRGLIHPPSIQHNVVQNGVNCMSVLVAGSVQGAVGQQAQLVTRFFFADGRPLFAHGGEAWYRDTGGFVATYTPQFFVTQDPQDLSVALTIPYYALNLVPTGMRMLYPLTALTDLFLNGSLALRSGHSPFSVYW